MAKITPASIKYIIYARFEAQGALEKPDVIGAVFGQTEGLLGEDMEMRELQKQGKIGRIEVNLENRDGMTHGEVEIPSAMDKNETSLIAAAIETIEKVGPCETKIIIDKIEDVRGSKRDFIMERAKQLLEGLGGAGNIKDFGKELQTMSRESSMKTYGTENIPCGDISGHELIIVEGRADVVNMLRQGIKNVICMNGAKLPESVKELTKQKETTLFVDGDRGGKLIIKNVSENANVNFIAVAPEGKEVEELTSKEILQSLRKRVPLAEYARNSERRPSRDSEERETREEKESEDESSSVEALTKEQKDKIKRSLDDMVGTKVAILFDKNFDIILKIPITRLPYARPEKKPYIIAINDTAQRNIIKIVEEFGAKILVAKNFSSDDTSLNLVSL